MALRDKLLIGSHYAMERFAVLVIACSIALVAVCVFCFRAEIEQNNIDFSNRSLYTSTIQSSISGDEGTMLGTFTNADRTRFAVMLDMGEENHASSDLNRYALTLAGTDENETLYAVNDNVSVGLYRLGDSGIYVYMFNCPDGFSSQLLYMLVQDSNGQSTADVTDLEANLDEMTAQELTSYYASMYDTYDFLFNPGGLDATVLDSLSGEKVNASQFYLEAVGQAQFDELVKRLEADNTAIALSLVKLNDIVDRLEENGVDVSGAFPAYMAEDELEATDDGSYVLHSGAAIPGGFDIDWRTIELGKTKVADIAPGYVHGGEEDVQAEDQSASEEAQNMRAIKKLEQWLMKDGSTLEALRAVDYDKYNTCVSDITALNEAINDYMELKMSYQTTDSIAVLDFMYEYEDMMGKIDGRTDDGLCTIIKEV